MLSTLASSKMLEDISKCPLCEQLEEEHQAERMHGNMF